MSFDSLALEELLKQAGVDPAMADLFGGTEQLSQIREKQKLHGDERLRLCQSILNVYNSPDGQVMFEYLVGAYIRRFNNVNALGLRADVALQLHAEACGQRVVVDDLLRMIHEARKPASPSTKQEA
jgi:hypothetical protein